MYRQWVLKTPRNQWKCWCIPDVKPWRNFQRILQLLKNIILTLMLWKRTNLTRRIASVSVRQGPSRRPSIADRLRGCPPEGTRVIPRQWYVSSFCPQISENWKIRRFLFIPSPISFMPDPKYLYWILLLFLLHPNLFMPNPNLFLLGPLRIPPGPYFYSYRICFIHAESEFIKSLLIIPESSNIILNWPLV